MKARFLTAIAALFLMSTAVHAQSRFEGRWASDPPDAGRGAPTVAFSSAPVYTSAPVFTNNQPGAGAPGRAPVLVPGAGGDALPGGVPTGPAPGALFGGPRGGATGAFGGPPSAPLGGTRGGPGGTAADGRSGAGPAEVRMDLRVQGSRLTGTIFAYGVERAVNEGIIAGKQARFKTARAPNGLPANSSPLLMRDANWTADMPDENTIVLRHEFTGGRGGPGEGGAVTLRRARP